MNRLELLEHDGAEFSGDEGNHSGICPEGDGIFVPAVGDTLRPARPPVEVTLRSSTPSATDAYLRRELPYQTLAST